MLTQGSALKKSIARRRTKLGALTALGATLTLAAGNAAAWTVDFFGFIPGYTSGGGLWYSYGYGPTMGSFTPNTTSDGQTILSLFFYEEPETGHYYTSMVVQFNTITPYAGWLNAMATPGGSLAGADAGFYCGPGPTPSNICSYGWGQTYTDLSQGGTVAINHD